MRVQPCRCTGGTRNKDARGKAEMRCSESYEADASVAFSPVFRRLENTREATAVERVQCRPMLLARSSNPEVRSREEERKCAPPNTTNRFPPPLSLSLSRVLSPAPAATKGAADLGLDLRCRGHGHVERSESSPACGGSNPGPHQPLTEAAAFLPSSRLPSTRPTLGCGRCLERTERRSPASPLACAAQRCPCRRALGLTFLVG